MFTPEQFLNSIRHETRVCQHLYEKIPDGGLDYRLGENMRTTMELMRYLANCVWIPATCILEGSWEGAKELIEETEKLEAKDFCSALDSQLEKIEDLIASIPPEDYANRKVKLPWGPEFLLGEALVDTCLKFISSYRLQFFTLIKAAGRPELNTANAWLGFDMPS